MPKTVVYSTSPYLALHNLGGGISGSKFTFNGVDQYAVIGVGYAALGKPRQWNFKFNAEAVASGLTQTLFSGVDGVNIEVFLSASDDRLGIRYREDDNSQAFELIDSPRIVAGEDTTVEIHTLGAEPGVRINGVEADLTLFGAAANLQPAVTIIGRKTTADQYFKGEIWGLEFIDESSVQDTWAVDGDDAVYISPTLDWDLSTGDVVIEWEAIHTTSLYWVICDAGPSSGIRFAAGAIRHFNDNGAGTSFPHGLIGGQHYRGSAVYTGPNVEFFIDGNSLGPAEAFSRSAWDDMNRLTGNASGGMPVNVSFQNIKFTRELGEDVLYKLNEESGTSVLAYTLDGVGRIPLMDAAWSAPVSHTFWPDRSRYYAMDDGYPADRFNCVDGNGDEVTAADAIINNPYGSGGGWNDSFAGYFISSVARGPYPVGDNGNDGQTPATAWRTLDKLGDIPAGEHDVYLNGPQTMTTTVDINTATVLNVHDAWGDSPAIFPGTQTYGMFLNDNQAGLNFIDPFVWDCTGQSTAGIAILNQSANGCAFSLPDGFHIIGSTVPRFFWMRDATGTCSHTVNIGAVTVEANTMPKRLLEFTATNTSTITIDGVDVGDQSGLAGTQYAILHAAGGASGLSLNVKNVKGHIETTGTNGLVFGIDITDSPDAIVEGVDITCGQSHSGGFSCPVRLIGTVSGENGTIRNGSVTTTTDRGYTALIGSDGVQQTAHNGTIENMVCTGPDSPTSTVHGAMISYCDNGTVKGCTLEYLNYGVLIKASTGSAATGNTVDYVTNDGFGLRAKGAINAVYSDNTVVIRSGYECDAMFVDLNVGTLSSGVEYNSNWIDMRSGADMTYHNFVTCGPADASEALWTGNGYTNTGGALPPLMWVYQGTDYSFLADWNASPYASGEINAQP